MPSEPLRPCPWASVDVKNNSGHWLEVCGGALIVDPWFWVSCSCGACGPQMPSKDAAIAAWNQRAEGKEADRAEA